MSDAAKRQHGRPPPIFGLWPGFPNARPSSSDTRLKFSNVRPSSSDVRPNSSDSRPSSPDSRLNASDCRPSFSDSRLNSSDMAKMAKNTRNLPNLPVFRGRSVILYVRRVHVVYGLRRFTRKAPPSGRRRRSGESRRRVNYRDIFAWFAYFAVAPSVQSSENRYSKSVAVRLRAFTRIRKAEQNWPVVRA